MYAYLKTLQQLIDNNKWLGICKIKYLEELTITFFSLYKVAITAKNCEQKSEITSIKQRILENKWNRKIEIFQENDLNTEYQAKSVETRLKFSLGRHILIGRIFKKIQLQTSIFFCDIILSLFRIKSYFKWCVTMIKWLIRKRSCKIG